MKSIREIHVVLFFALILRASYTTLLHYQKIQFTEEADLYFRLLGKLLMYSVIIGFPILFFDMWGKKSEQILGRPQRLVNIAQAAIIGVIIFFFAFTEDQIEKFILFHLKIDHKYFLIDTFPTLTESTFDHIDWLFIFLSTALLAPVAEEFFFRGLLFTLLRDKAGDLKAAVYCSFLFTILHYPNIFFISTMVFSLILSYIYIKTRSIWLCISAHSAFNVSALILEKFPYNEWELPFEYSLFITSPLIMSIALLLSGGALIYTVYKIAKGKFLTSHSVLN